MEAHLTSLRAANVICVDRQKDLPMFRASSIDLQKCPKRLVRGCVNSLTCTRFTQPMTSLFEPL